MLDNLFGGSSKKKRTRRGLPPHPPGYEESEAGFINSSYPQQQFTAQSQFSQFPNQSFGNETNIPQQSGGIGNSYEMNSIQNSEQEFLHQNNMSMSMSPGNFQIDQVAEYARQLFSQGYSEPQVVSELRKQGIPFQTIDQVIKSVLRNDVLSNQNSLSGEDSYESFSFDSLTPTIREEDIENYNFEEGNEGAEYEESYEESLTPEEEGYGFGDINRLEEIVEAVLEERLKEFMEKINALEMKIRNIENNISSMNESIEGVKKSHESDINNIKNTISDIMEKVNKLEPKINGFEKAFKDIVPELVDEVKELKEIINLKIKREEKMEKITL